VQLLQRASTWRSHWLLGTAASLRQLTWYGRPSKTARDCLSAAIARSEHVVSASLNDVGVPKSLFCGSSLLLRCPGKSSPSSETGLSSLCPGEWITQITARCRRNPCSWPYEPKSVSRAWIWLAAVHRVNAVDAAAAGGRFLS
jgi:hypothetical protein